MSYTGQAYTPSEPSARVTGAVVTDQRLAVDWVEGTRAGNLVATSEDGVVFRGTYGYPRPSPLYHVVLTLYRAANGEVVLLGRWWEQDSPAGGTWVIRLEPA